MNEYDKQRAIEVLSDKLAMNAKALLLEMAADRLPLFADEVLSWNGEGTAKMTFAIQIERKSRFTGGECSALECIYDANVSSPELKREVLPKQTASADPVYPEQNELELD